MTSGCAHPGRVWGCGRFAGRSVSYVSREPPLQDWLDNWQLRGTPCGPISSRVCKPHLMTPPVSQGFRYWESMSTCGTTRTDAATSSKTPWVTAGARVIPSIKSGFFCAPRAADSPHVKRNASVRPSWQMRRISVSKSPTTAPSKYARSSTKPYPPKADAWPHTSLNTYQRGPSPNSLAWAGPYASGRMPSWPTSTQAEPATAPPKPSTDIIELGRRTARGYRNPTNYKLRMLLIAGGLDASTHTQL